ncbi:MAG: adenylate/guanylate cyclase domain-containing protein [Chloroflexota bacterium]
MVCGSCGTENPGGAKFCNSCGARLALTCAACGAANTPGARFCNECGSPLGAGGPAPAQAPRPASEPSRPTVGTHSESGPVAERRLVTILFADLVGFTTFSEGRDAEEVRELLTRYFDLCRQLIERYGGTVEKFIGDAVMAVFGAPIARENDAERAVRAALELVDAVPTLAPGVRARAGVLTGEAAVTLGATNQGMVAGDLVNTASRLQSAAPVGAVLVGEATQRATSNAIAYEPAGDQVLKGKATPVPAWLATRVVAEVGGRNRADTLEAPFVGRDEELRWLKELFHATRREGRARLMSVVGPAGVGKSRLAWEFLKYTDGLVDELWWHQGRSPAYGQGLSFWALGEMVRVRCKLLEGDDERTTRERVAATVAQFVTDADERRWIETALLALLGVGQAPGGGDALFPAWRTFFDRMAQQDPVVMVFEDLHWADLGTMDFIDHLLEWSKHLPYFVVTLARPELMDRRPDWGAGKRSFTSLPLEPLPEPAMRQLLAGLVPGLPESAVRTIVGRADGMPLYAVETVRMLLADGKLREEDGRYVPAGDLSDLAVPDSLTALISARLDALDPVDRTILQDGSVLGTSFTLAGLAAVTGMEATEIEARVRGLVRRELLRVEADARSAERGQYAFVQALIREVAYNTLSKRDRKALHLAAARWFEAAGSEELAGVLARHYFAAWQATPAGPEADALAAQARVALVGAADRAVGLGAHDQAVDYLRQALDVTTEPTAEADLLIRIGASASSTADHDAAEEATRRALVIYQGLGNTREVIGASAELGRVLLNAYRTEAALEVLRAAPAADDALAGDPLLINFGSQLARALMFSGDARGAIAASDQVLEAAERANLVPLIADALVTRGTSLANVARMYEGQGVIEAGRQLAEAHGLTRVLLRALNNQGGLLAATDPRRSLAVHRQVVDLARRSGTAPCS